MDGNTVSRNDGVSKSRNDGDAISARDGAVIRDLGKRLAEVCALPAQAQKRDLWYRHNDLGGTRPLVFCDPENGWNEIIRPEDLQCEGPLAREWEARLRRELFWGTEMGDDRVCEPVFPVGFVSADSGFGLAENRHQLREGGAYNWDAPLKTFAQMDRLHPRHIEVDPERSRQRLEQAQALLGDTLQVVQRTFWWWTCGLTMSYVYLRGLEQMMYDMVDEPDDVHRLMAFLRDDMLHLTQDLEQRGLLPQNHDGAYVGSGGFGYTRQLPADGFDPAHVRLRDMWGFAESQETVNISPAMFEEFVFPYQLPILSQFGLNCYGCCEPVEGRWHLLEKIPNLRRVSVSPWSNAERMGELLGSRYLFSYKPNPSRLALPDLDENAARADLRRGIAAAGRHGCMEIIMKDNHTIGRNPENVKRWCRMAREEAERV